MFLIFSLFSKTFGFGIYNKKTDLYTDEIHIRELSLSEGGLGCALWDASIIVARYFYNNPNLIKDKEVLELGSGCGLTGIVAGLYAKKSILSDYMQSVVDNISYNINVNLNDHSETVTIPRNKLSTCSAILLDWDEPLTSIHDSIEKVDYIFGTELVYTPDEHHQESLIKVIKKYLKPDGKVFFCQSDNRLDMPQFLTRIESYGFTVTISKPDQSLLGNYQSKQVYETYQFYEFQYKH